MFKKIRIQVKLDIRKDAWNWWDACNKISYGIDWDEEYKLHQKIKKTIRKFLEEK